MWSKLLDSALVIAFLSAALYFLGLLNTEGDASALGLPRLMLSRELWDTVAYGGEGLLALTILLPFAIVGPAGIGWQPVFTLLFAVIVGVVVAFLSKKSPHRASATGIGVYIALCVHVMLASQLQMVKRVEIAAACIRDKQCAAAPLPNRVVFSKTDTEEDERIGILLAVSGKFLVMLSAKGMFLLPLDRLKALETARSDSR